MDQMSVAARSHRSAAQGASLAHTERIGKRCNAALRFDDQRRPTDDRGRDTGIGWRSQTGPRQASVRQSKDTPLSKKTKPAMGEDTAIGNGAPAAEGNLANARNRRRRLRAAWMSFIEEMTQNEIPQHLGVGRVTVVRLLSDARERREIMIRIESRLPKIVGPEREVEQRFGLSEAVVVPLVAAEADATKSI